MFEMQLELNKKHSNFAKDKQDEAKTAWKILLWNAKPDYEKYKVITIEMLGDQILMI